MMKNTVCSFCGCALPATGGCPCDAARARRAAWEKTAMRMAEEALAKSNKRGRKAGAK
jgi:hypothetical protein